MHQLQAEIRALRRKANNPQHVKQASLANRLILMRSIKLKTPTSLSLSRKEVALAYAVLEAPAVPTAEGRK